MPQTQHGQEKFGEFVTFYNPLMGGLNGQGAPHLIGENEVQRGSNIDFTLEWGAAMCRRGESVFGNLSLENKVTLLNRSFTSTVSDSSPWYGADQSSIYRGTLVTSNGSASGTNTLSMTTIRVGTQTSRGLFTAYNSLAYIANGTLGVKDDGTNTWDWILPQPPTPTSAFSTDPGFLEYNGTWSASNGTLVGTSTSSGTVLSTFTLGGISGVSTFQAQVIVATLGTATNWENPTTVIEYGSGSTTGHILPLNYTIGTAGTNLGTATYTIGPYGIDYIYLSVEDAGIVNSIARDLSIGDTSFTNYWHAETNMTDLSPVIPSGAVLSAAALAQFANQTPATIPQTTVNLVTGAIGQSPSSAYNPIDAEAASDTTFTNWVGNLSGVLIPWAIPRTDYQLVGTNTSTTGWTNINAIRISVNYNASTGATGLLTGLIVGEVKTLGSEIYSLTDQNAGIQYWETYCQVGTSTATVLGTATTIQSILAESTPATPTPLTLTSNGEGQLVFSTFTDTATTGITHRAIYRSGGFLQYPYQVGVIPISSNTAFDFGQPDLVVLQGTPLTQYLWASPWPGVNTVSEPFQDRIFVGSGNELFWTRPGLPSEIQNDTDVTISQVGDPIQSIQVWDRLIIVNQNTVYEMDGTVWEGASANWDLRKTGSKRGCAAGNTCLKTPDGVFLFDYTGVSLYTPGHSVDTPMTWVNEKILDIWQGNGPNDPCAMKGYRLPPINQSAIQTSCAAYHNQRIYLAVPTGTSTLPNTMFVLDNTHHIVWYYTYNFNIISLYHDPLYNRLLAGTDQGEIKLLESGTTDEGAPINWSIFTRTWTTPMVDWIIENCLVEAVGPITATAIYNGTTGTNTQTLGTFTNTSKLWQPLTALGTVENDITFGFSGSNTSSQGVFNITWDALPIPMKVAFYITDPAKLSGATALDMARFFSLDVEIAPQGTFTNTWIIDNIGVSTNTYVNTNTFERYFIDFQPFPPGCRGYLLQQQYNSSPPMRMRKSYIDLERIGIKGLSRIGVIDMLGKNGQVPSR